MPVRVIRSHYQLLLIGAVVAALWSTPVLLPLKILVVFLHELSHAMAAWLTGGSVDWLTLSIREGGAVQTRGGNLFLIRSAGYVGSLLIGVFLFLVALRTRADRAVMGALGLVTIAVTAVYVREPFPLVFGAFAGLGMLAMAWYLSREINDLALRIIGLTSMIYVPLDIFSDTIARSHLPSDAFMLAQDFGGTAVMWGGLWLLISAGVIGLCLRYGLGTNSNLVFGRERAE